MSIIERIQDAGIILFKPKEVPNKNVSNIATEKDKRRTPDKKTFIIGELSSITCRTMALRCPLFMKGSYKRTGDIFNNWLEVVKRNGDPIGNKTQNVIDEFDDRTNLRDKMFIAGICNDIYGDIFLERTFMKKVGNSYVPIIERPGTKPNFKREPLNINVINPEFIYKIDKKQGSDDKTNYYHCKGKLGPTKYIHPERIIHKSEIKLPYSKFGSSKVDIGYNIINALMNTDEISGEILDWFSTGMYFMTKKGLTPAEQDKAIEQFNEHPRFIVVDDEYKMEVHNPTRIDPEPFYEHYYTKVAALFRMPRQLLIGAEVGAITGSEVGFADYVASVYHLREMYGNILVEIYKQLLKSKGMEWGNKILWNKTYIDELSESKTMEKRALVATALIDRKIITREESRRIMNEGQIRLDVHNPEGDFIEPNPNAQPMLPNVEPPKKKKKKKKKDEDEEEEEKEVKQEKPSFDIFEDKGKLEEALQDKRLVENKKE